MRGRAFIAGSLMLAAVVSGCSMHATGTVPAPAPGEVTGFAELCSGLPATMLRPSPSPMVVYVQQHGQTIAQQKLPGIGGVYHFSLPPGSYVVSAPRSKDPPQGIMLHSKDTLTVNFPNRCI